MSCDLRIVRLPRIWTQPPGPVSRRRLPSDLGRRRSPIPRHPDRVVQRRQVLPHHDDPLHLELLLRQTAVPALLLQIRGGEQGRRRPRRELGRAHRGDDRAPAQY